MSIVANVWAEELSKGAFTITSESIIEIDQGEVLYIAGMLKNYSHLELKEEVEVVLPEGWQLVAGDRKVSAAPDDSILVIMAIKASNQALAGDYPIQIILNGDYRQECSIRVIVRPKSSFEMRINNLQEFYAMGDPIELSIECFNKGNLPLNLRFEARGDPLCKLIYHSEPFQISPNNTEKLFLYLEPFLGSKDEQQFILYKVFNVDTGEQIYQNTTNLRFSPMYQSEDDLYIRIPGHVSMMALGDNSKYVMAVEWAGGGCIDPVRERYLDYCLRLPTDSQNVIYNIDQRLFVGIEEPNWDLNFGDTVYQLTPLTQNYRYGRGAGVDIANDYWNAGGHYTQNVINNDYNPRELCFYIGYSPCQQWTLTSSYLHKTLQHTPTSNIVTIRSEATLSANIHTDIEVGKDFSRDSWHGDTMAYHFRVHGRCFDDTWFDIDKVYAGPDFYGYYQYLHLFSSSIDFPLGKSIRCNVNVNRLRQNYNIYKYPDPYAVSPRQHQYGLNLTYNVSSKMTVCLNSLLFRGQDVGLNPQYNFYQKWAGFTLFFTQHGYFFNSMMSFGQQKDYLSKQTSHFLQTYNVVIGRDFSPTLSVSVFYEGGNTNYYDARPWRTSIGGCYVYRYSPRGNFGFFAQKVKNTPDMFELSQISLTLNHTFKNQHHLYVSAQYFNYKKHYPNDALFLLSYTIPLSTPIGERKDIGSLNGCVYDVWRECPVSQAVVNCNGNQALTDINGHFQLPYMPVGDKTLKVDVLPADLIPLQANLQTIELSSGASSQVVIPVIPKSSLKGQIIRYGYEDLVEHWDDIFEKIQWHHMIDMGGIESVRVILSNEDEVYVSTTNSKGEYQFPKLRPGSWNLVVAAENIPDMHELDMNNLVIDISPEENKEIKFRVSPQPIYIRKIE